MYSASFKFLQYFAKYPGSLHLKQYIFCLSCTLYVVLSPFTLLFLFLFSYFFLYDFEDHRFFFFLNVFNLFSSAKNLAIRFINVFSAAGLQSHALAKYLKISGNVVRIFYIVTAFSTYFI